MRGDHVGHRVQLGGGQRPSRARWPRCAGQGHELPAAPWWLCAFSRKPSEQEKGNLLQEGSQMSLPIWRIGFILEKTLWRHDSPTPRGQSWKCPSSPPYLQRPALSFSPTPSKPQKVNSLGYRPRSFRPSRPIQPCPSQGSRMPSENTTHRVWSAAPVYWPPAPADGELSGPPDGRNPE